MFEVNLLNSNSSEKTETGIAVSENRFFDRFDSIRSYVLCFGRTDRGRREKWKLNGWWQAHGKSGSADSIFGFHCAVEKGTEPVEMMGNHVSQWVPLKKILGEYS